MTYPIAMSILEKIIQDKKKEVQLRKAMLPASKLEGFGLFDRQTVSLKNTLKAQPIGIIAEHKRRSPSRAVINQDCSVSDIVEGYAAAGAGGISILTDGKYFGGSLDDLLLARASTALPLLRKEFIIDPYQILEARAYGADAVLLIAAVLSKEALKSLCASAHALDLEVLLEVHSRAELEFSLDAGADLIGVNNRNLKTFEVSLEISRELSGLIPEAVGKISESGLKTPDQIRELKKLGFDGFLMGETFMKTAQPGKALGDFLKKTRE
ncbi:indole-3-glycerol phosphate synthase TrpC [Robiginitalea sp.]|uniref:indole-3-glycerol phosphate synthase TrpC n=1 Tax=Robiginitalea sp. TaxID=1902411 RepID=UPI003C71F4FC